MDRSLLDRLGYAVGHGPLSRRRALGRLGRAGVASVVAGTAVAAPAVRAQSEAQSQTQPSNQTTGDGRNGALPGDAGEAPAGSSELVVPSTTREELGPPDAAPAGALRRLTDYDRSLWLNSGEGWTSLDGHVFDVRGFGALGDGVTDDWAAFDAAIEAMVSPLAADTTTAYGRTLIVPPGRYRLGQSLVLSRAVRLVGAVGSGRVGDAILAPDAGIVGIVVEAADPPVRAQDGRRGEGALVERLRIEAGPSPATAARGGSAAQETDVATDAVSVPGVLLRSRATLRDCAVVGFPGDGILIDAGGDAGDPFEADGWEVVGCRVEACGGHGLNARGGSAGVGSQILAVGNGGWGIIDNSDRGNTYLQCRGAGNGEGAFASGGDDNRTLFLGCASDPGQARSLFADDTLVVGGSHDAGYVGGNAWVADESRVLLRAQAQVGGDEVVPTVPTLHLLAAIGQTQPHLRIGDRNGDRLAEFDAAGRLLVGPADLVAAGGRPDAPDVVGQQPVQVQISHEESGQAALRWAVGGQAATWVAQARAFHEPSRPIEQGGAPDPATRLVFQTAGPAGQELDTLTLRAGRVGIGTTAPSAAAVLDLASAGLGFLPPRLTTEQRDAIASPPEGLTIYNRTTRRLNVHDGEAWRELSFA